MNASFSFLTGGKKVGGWGGVKGRGHSFAVQFNTSLKLFAIKVIQQIFERNPTNKDG